jgi:hypothetical protein
MLLKNRNEWAQKTSAYKGPKNLAREGQEERLNKNLEEKKESFSRIKWKRKIPKKLVQVILHVGHTKTPLQWWNTPKKVQKKIFNKKGQNLSKPDAIWRHLTPNGAGRYLKG